MTVEAASSTTSAWLIACGLSLGPAEVGWINTANAIVHRIGGMLRMRVEGASAALAAAFGLSLSSPGEGETAT